jgi:hypothetical protein
VSANSLGYTQASPVTIRQAMDAVPGLTRDALLKQLSRLTRAKRAIVIQDQGQVTDILYVEDHAIQRAAVRDAMELRGEFPAKQVQLEGRFSVESSHPLVGELSRLQGAGELTKAELLALAGVAPEVIEAERVALATTPGAEADAIATPRRKRR